MQNTDKELQIQKLRFFRLANGILAIGYLAFFAWLLASAYNVIF